MSNPSTRILVYIYTENHQGSFYKKLSSCRNCPSPLYTRRYLRRDNDNDNFIRWLGDQYIWKTVSLDTKFKFTKAQIYEILIHLPGKVNDSDEFKKYTIFFKNMFRQFSCHLQFWFIQSTKLNLKSITKCSWDKINNRNKTMYAIKRKLLNFVGPLTFSDNYNISYRNKARIY